jgi:hypothetical protein
MLRKMPWAKRALAPFVRIRRSIESRRRTLRQARLKASIPSNNNLPIFNLGVGIGVLRNRWLLREGKIVFWIKDYIDRKFI